MFQRDMEFGNMDFPIWQSGLGKIPDQMVLQKHLLKLEYNIHNFKLVGMRVTQLKCYTETNKLCNEILSMMKVDRANKTMVKR
jgi:hypothetical protein